MCFIGGQGDPPDEEVREQQRRAEENQDVVEEITPGPPADSPTFLGARTDEDRIGAAELTGIGDTDVRLPTIDRGGGTPGPSTPPGTTPGGGRGGGFEPSIPNLPGLPRIPGGVGRRRRRF